MWVGGGLLQDLGALNVAVHAWDVLKEVTIIFPGGSDGKESACQCRRPRFDHLWVGKIPLEKAMTPHSSILAWKIPWVEEPGGLQSTGS